MSNNNSWFHSPVLYGLFSLLLDNSMLKIISQFNLLSGLLLLFYRNKKSYLRKTNPLYKSSTNPKKSWVLLVLCPLIFITGYK